MHLLAADLCPVRKLGDRRRGAVDPGPGTIRDRSAACSEKPRDEKHSQSERTPSSGWVHRLKGPDHIDEA